jgi:hypothetical protein
VFPEEPKKEFSLRGNLKSDSPDEKNIENYDEQRLLSLESQAFSITYGKDLMRKHPGKFDFIKMIFNLSEHSKRINQVVDYIANTADILMFIVSEMLPNISTHDQEYLLHALKRCFEEGIKFPPEFVEELFAVMKDRFDSSHKQFSVMKLAMTSISNEYGISEDQFFEYSDLINFKGINYKKNDWANPWKASERLRLYVLLNNLD